METAGRRNRRGDNSEISPYSGWPGLKSRGSPVRFRPSPHPVEKIPAIGSGRLDDAVTRNIDTGAGTRVDPAAMFIFIGTAPQTEMGRGVLELDEKGFILTAPDLPRTVRGVRGWNLDRDPFMFETNIPGIFAAGDVRSCADRRVAAAVGEGSAAIRSVLRYLQTV